ncbi:MAG: hypothetical protein ACYC0X_01040 [Pirellulaceae bacterium]
MRHAVVILVTASLIGLTGGCQKDATYTETPLEQAGDNAPAVRTPPASTPAANSPPAHSAGEPKTPDIRPAEGSQRTLPPAEPGATTPSTPEQKTPVDQKPTETDADQTIDVPPVVGGSEEEPE